MQFVIDNWMLLSVALASGAMLVWPTVRGASAGGLTPAAAVLLMNRSRAVVVDVSEPDEYAKAHIGGARNVPLGQLEQRLPEVVKNKALPVILVCPTGARANRAVATAKKLGYEQVEALSGGLDAWKEANLPLQKA